MSLRPGHGPGRGCFNERARRIRRKLRAGLLERHHLDATTEAIELRLTIAANYLVVDRPEKAAGQLEAAERDAQMVSRAACKHDNRAMIRVAPREDRLTRLQERQRANMAAALEAAENAR